MNFVGWTKKQTGWFFIAAYLVASLIGFVVYEWFKDVFNSVLVLTFMANLSMTIVIYIFSLITKNASMYDPYWSVIPPIILIWWLIDLNIDITPVVLLLSIGMMVWAIRLTYNWWKNWTGFKEQDWRYDLIQERSKGFYFLSNFIAIHLVPTLIVYLQMINVYQIIQSGATIHLWTVLGFMLMLFAAMIQFIADKQMYDFRKTRKSKDICIDQGLWRYSRHPNYLGELSMWVGVYFIYLGAYQMIDINIAFPLLMIALFLFVSIPMMEKKLIDRPGYKTYQKKVSMLFPYRKLK